MYTTTAPATAPTITEATIEAIGIWVEAVAVCIGVVSGFDAGGLVGVVSGEVEFVSDGVV